MDDSSHARLKVDFPIRPAGSHGTHERTFRTWPIITNHGSVAAQSLKLEFVLPLKIQGDIWVPLGLVGNTEVRTASTANADSAAFEIVAHCASGYRTVGNDGVVTMRVDQAIFRESSEPYEDYFVQFVCDQRWFALNRPSLLNWCLWANDELPEKGAMCADIEGGRFIAK